MLDGLDWAGLPVVAEILGVVDIETLVRQMIVIRDWQKQNARDRSIS